MSKLGITLTNAWLIEQHNSERFEASEQDFAVSDEGENCSDQVYTL